MLGICFAVIPRGHSENGLGGDEHGQGDYNDRRTRVRETVIDGKTGFLVPVKNAEAVAEKMTEFIENPELIKTLGAASAEYAREKFSVDKVNDDMCCHLNIERTNKYAVV